MKKNLYILLAFIFTVISCGKSDLSSKWENEGKMSEDRLLPSELYEVLGQSDGWKLVYEDNLYYFQFQEGKIVISETGPTILEAEVESDYFVDYDGEDVLIINIDGGGAMAYADTPENQLLVTEFTSSKITAKGKKSGSDMTLTPVELSEIEKNLDLKYDAMLEYQFSLGKKELLTSLNNFVVTNESGAFLAYCEFAGENPSSITVSQIIGGVLTHSTKDITITRSGETSLITFNPVAINGINFSEINLEFYTSKSISNGHFTLKSNTEGVDFLYKDGFKTHAINYHSNTGAASADIWEELNWSSIGSFEVNDRVGRPFIFCPGSVDPKVWYHFYRFPYVNDTEIGVVKYTDSPVQLDYGGTNMDAQVRAQCPKLFELLLDEDGVNIVFEETSTQTNLYFFSTTSTSWFKAVKSK